MIQRIQSVYLFLITVACLVIFMVPLASFTSEAGHQVIMNACHFELSENFPFEDQLPSLMFVAITLLVLAALPLINIFLYKNRVLQLRINRITMIVNIILIGVIFMAVDPITELMQVNAVYHIGAYLALLPVVFSFLANQGIRKDEAKVRAADRLR